jgi:hypothetical protein
MTVLVTPDELEKRGAIARGPLEPLAASLIADLEPILATEVVIPAEKALLSREGDRCPRHAVLLEFDPLSPRFHRCPVDGEAFAGELHDRFWIYWYQLWLAERAVHGALLQALGFGDRFGAFARGILERYAEGYLRYPNIDNVLGPTRLFFSTYLESIWLLQVVVATELLERCGARKLGETVRDRIVEPSRALIASYDEGLSNRQVWNNAALLAAARLVGDELAAEQAVYGGSGLTTHLAQGLLVDGSWYEGENYHLFAHRGLWYGVTMAERAGLELSATIVERFQEGFVVPFATALPDFTLPSRRDSQYAISLRQWRMAEHCELGLARTEDPRLAAALARLYAADIPRGDTGRSRSSADVERNVPPTNLTRADLNWRALVHALPVLPTADREAAATPSAVLEGQGIAVFRRPGDVYAALDYGHHGGGHGHPDRLNLLLVHGDKRWLDDMGTGSYVDPSLHWYRSTLAHNAPLVNGRSQERVHGSLLAYDERDGAGWIMASAEEIAPGASVARTLVVMKDYLVDELEWRADARIKLDLPLHVDARIVRGAGEPHPDRLNGGDGLEDGFQFLRDMSIQRAEAGAIVELATADAALRAWWTTDGRTEWWRARAPGAPGKGDHTFLIARAIADSGAHRGVWCWSKGVVGVLGFDPLTIELADGTRHIHRRTEPGWTVDVEHHGEQSRLELGGMVDVDDEDVPVVVPAPPEIPQELGVATIVEADLGAESYQRSESSWTDAGEPSALVTIEWTGRALLVGVDVHGSDRTFVARDAVNPYDNEAPDINGDGVQFYVATHLGRSGWVLVPETGSHTVRSRLVEGWSTDLPIDAEWHTTPRGYRMDIELRLDALHDFAQAGIALDVVVNEKPAGRERRRGQLVLSGGRGEFVYLRGDRHDPSRLIPFALANA